MAMKTFVIFLGLLAIVAADDDCPFAKLIQESTMKCAKEKNLDEDGVKKVLDLGGELSEETKCFMACIARESGFTDGSKISMEKVEEALKTAKDLDDVKKQQLIGIWRSCQPEAEVSDNECEVAGNYAKCMTSKLEGIDM